MKTKKSNIISDVIRMNECCLQYLPKIAEHIHRTEGRIKNRHLSFIVHVLKINNPSRYH